VTDPGSPSAPIPYQGAHDGPRRVLHLQVKRVLKNAGAVHVNIDGLAHVVSWGPVFFEIPADRPVIIRAHQFDILQRMFGQAEVVLAPEAPAELEYQSAAHNKVEGEMGPPGTTRVRGRARLFWGMGCLMLGAVGFVVLFTVVLILIMM